jgi:hypothetical protein
MPISTDPDEDFVKQYYPDSFSEQNGENEPYCIKKSSVLPDVLGFGTTSNEAWGDAAEKIRRTKKNKKRLEQS